MEKQKDLELAKQEALHLIVVCATDIVNAWPTLTLRMLGSMTNKIDTLKQAVNEYKKFL